MINRRSLIINLNRMYFSHSFLNLLKELPFISTLLIGSLYVYITVALDVAREVVGDRVPKVIDLSTTCCEKLI